MAPRVPVRLRHPAIAAAIVVVALAAVACAAPSAEVVVDAPSDPPPVGSLAVVRTAASESEVQVVPPGGEDGATVSTTATGTFTGVDWVPGREWLVVTHVGPDGGEVRRLAATGRASTTTWTSPRPVHAPRVAPDGRRVVVAAATANGGADLVVLMQADRPDVVLRGDDHVVEPRWACAPTGPGRAHPVGWLDADRLVAEVRVHCHEAEFADLLVVDVTTGEADTLLPDVDPGSSRVDPAGRSVTATRPATGVAVRVDPDTGEHDVLGTGLATVESADRSLASVRPEPRGEGAGLRLVVAPPGHDLRTAREVTGLRDVAGISWRPDGEELAAVVQRADGSQLWIVDPSRGRARRVDGGYAASVIVDMEHADG